MSVANLGLYNPVSDHGSFFVLDSREGPRSMMHSGSSVARRAALNADQLMLGIEPTLTVVASEPLIGGSRAIEAEDFPFEAISKIAESESWRKEVNRPLTHIHKWWAQRLGSVFRAVTIGALAPSDANIMELFYSRARFPGAAVFDPFMGSGTTVVETLKLGARAVGRDINPVAYFLVRNAVAVHGRKAVLSTFKDIERDVAAKLKSYYVARLPDGTKGTVLYYFWVKQLPCPACDTAVDLFSSRIFARHAYAKKFPEARATCPQCGDVNRVRFDATDAECKNCHIAFDPSTGAASGQKACCPACSHEFGIAKTVRNREEPPSHRLYAKLVLLPDGRKEYFPADSFDAELFTKASHELAMQTDPYPIVDIEPGYNTNQALNYNYRQWHQFFNARQLLCLSILAKRIQQVPDRALRELFTCLFSGTLEFNNMFASYKGEGTGAVRHMFSHHILKPERTPLEANLWGTPKSSGSFSTLFETRILRALDYADNPFELKLSGKGTSGTEKVFGFAEAMGSDCADSFEEFFQGAPVYLSCGDSSATDLPDHSIDAVVTDPPFFDNVNYSQLADFFHVWQRHVLGTDGCRMDSTTRMPGEVQHGEEDVFRDRLGAVWGECHRVLKDNGLLVFSYHHSRTEGWRSVLQALMRAGFGIVAAHPVKAEMSVAMPKQQAKEPIDLDIIVVCRKLKMLRRGVAGDELLSHITAAAAGQIERFNAADRFLSRNDIRIIVMAHLLRLLSTSVTTEAALEMLDGHNGSIEKIIADLHEMNIQRKNAA